ncbi:MAG: glycosyltransferase family 4 protein [Pseudomonadota bacterium]
MDALIATSQQAASYLDRDAQVIMHGIDTERFSPPETKEAAKEALGLPTEDLFLGCFGRVRENKGTDIFVDALISVCQADRRVRGVVLGRATQEHAEFQARLEAKVRNAGLLHRIRFMGEVPVEDVPKWYSALDLFIAPQRWEGFGLTPLEAMASGVPVVATRVGAFEEIILEGKTGTLVEPGDLTAMERAILDALDGDLAGMGAAAYAHVTSNFEIGGEARAILDVYDRLLQET